MKAAFFPLGDTRLNHCDGESIWRETSFALELVRQCVNPKLNLTHCIRNWDRIKNKLAGSQRKRALQLDNLLR